MKKYFKKYLSSAIFSGFGLFTLLFFSPLEVFMGNPSDFRFSLDLAIVVLGITALLCTLVFSAVVSFLPVKILKLLNLSVLGVALCFYFQTLFMNNAMSILTGEVFTVSRSAKLINCFAWLIIFVAVFVAWFFFKKYRKEKLFINITKYLALAFVAMQLTGFISMYIGYDKTDNLSKSVYYSVDERLQVSEKNNVLYFVVDFCDTTIINEALQHEPDLFDDFNGFTFYNDNLYTHVRSFPAITYLLSGEKCYYDINYTDYIDNAMKNSKFIQKMDEIGTDIRLYTDPRFVGTQVIDKIDNCKVVYGETPKMELKPFLIQAIKVSAYRGMPYLVKNRFHYDTETINQSVLIQHEDAAPVNNDPEFYSAILAEKVSINKDYSSAFRFYHMYGSHPGAVINENAEYEADVTLQQALRGDIKIIEAYLEQLKATGAYDNSTIIITADHGEFMGYLEKPQTCLLLVKPAGADTSKPIQYSNAPVSHENLHSTIIKALGEDYSEFGVPLDEVAEDAQIKRYHYNTEVDMSSGYETVMKEYEVIGSAADMNNYRQTGRQWRVTSSISPHY